MATTWEVKKEMYPNLMSTTLPWVVGCASARNLVTAEKVFKRFCPKTFKIINVSWVKSTQEPHCIWRVAYNLNSLAVLPEEGDHLKELYSLLEKHHPSNTSIIHVHHSRNALIDYGVYCQCAAPNFEKAEQSPGQPAWGTLLEDIGNVKIVAVEEKD